MVELTNEKAKAYYSLDAHLDASIPARWWRYCPCCQSFTIAGTTIRSHTTKVISLSDQMTSCDTCRFDGQRKFCFPQDSQGFSAACSHHQHKFVWKFVNEKTFRCSQTSPNIVKKCENLKDNQHVLTCIEVRATVIILSFWWKFPFCSFGQGRTNLHCLPLDLCCLQQNRQNKNIFHYSLQLGNKKITFL